MKQEILQRKWGRLNRNSIVFKYLMAFILIIIIPLIIFSIALNKIYLKVIINNTSDRTMQAMEQISLGIENQVKRISLTAATIANDYEIIEYMNSWNHADDMGSKFDISKKTDTRLNYIFNYTNDVDSVIFFFKDKGFYAYKGDLYINEEDIRNMDWYRKSLNNKGMTFIPGSLKSFIYNSRYRYVIPVAISPDILQDTRNVELIYLAFGSNIFDSFYSGMKLKNVGEMLVTDETGKIMISKNYDNIGKNASDFSHLKESAQLDYGSYISAFNEKKLFVTVYKIGKTGWKIINMTDYKEVTRDIDRILSVIKKAFAVIMVLFLAFSVFFFNGIVVPINHLINKMKVVEKGNFNTTIQVMGKGEVRQLSESFNTMVYKINNLIKQRDINEKKKIQAEIEALQSQINPHFISNTLNSIRLMAMIAKVDSIKNMSEAFMKLLMATIGKGDTFVTIDSELNNLENYIYIMRVRYGDKFDVQYDIDENIRNLFILKLLLQPVVENSILHGLSEIEGKGLIRISGHKKGEELILEIYDNGVGMTEEQAKRLLTESNSNRRAFSSMGIMNVNRRIRLNHGERFGIEIESVCGKFTNVRMRLPVITGILGD